MLFTPFTSPSGVSAIEGDSGVSVDTTSTNGTSDISTRATTPTVGISLPSTLDFTNSTNDSAGYSLYLYSTNGNNSLKSTNPATTSSITATDATVVLGSLENNTWGYNLGTTAPTTTTTYTAVPTDNSTPIQTKDTSTTNSANDTYTLTFGAKVDTNLPSGTYSNTLTIAVVAEPKAIADITGLTYMQDMTPEVCAETEVGTTTRLTDKRDNKQYWVTKLADNNCWMTQNLDLDIPASGLTNTDSDINNASGVWDANSQYPPLATERPGVISEANSSLQAFSWDLGMYIKSDPSAYNDCDRVKSLSVSRCTSAGWTDVSSMTPMSDSNTDVIISDNTYNAHYLIGNLYQWNAATAGTGGTVINSNAPDSICPKGWQLPASSYSGSYQALIGAYNIGYNTASSITITQAPLYFIPSGHINSGSLSSAGSRGNYWSSTADTSASSAYTLNFYLGAVTASNTSYRYVGSSVRCIARQ